MNDERPDWYSGPRDTAYERLYGTDVGPTCPCRGKGARQNDGLYGYVVTLGNGVVARCSACHAQTVFYPSPELWYMNPRDVYASHLSAEHRRCVAMHGGHVNAATGHRE